MTMPSVCTVGGSGVGLSFRLPHAARPGETLTCESMTYVNGGKAANQAIGAARLGARAEIVTAVGEDPMGDIALDTLRRHGVGLSGVSRCDDRPTMVGALLVDRDGENVIVVAPGALASVDSEFVDSHAELVRGCDVCLVSLEIPASGAERAMRHARDAGRTTILNPAPAGDPTEIADLLAHSDIVTPNETEARALTGMTTPVDQARGLLEAGAKAVVLTRGAKGAYVLVRGGHPVEIAAPQVAAVDTSGAGDAFNAALAVAVAGGTDLVRAVEFACEAASRIVRATAFVEALDQWAGLEVP